VLDGPTCADGYRWWQVRLEADGTIGWVADSDQVGYWIEMASATPPPDGPPPSDTASISFTAYQNAINAGECVNLSWDVSGIKEVYFLGDGSIEEGVTGTGSRVVHPEPPATTYYLKVIKQDDSIVYPEVTIYVGPARTDGAFNVVPTTITVGECVTITWEIHGYCYDGWAFRGAFGEKTYFPGQTGSITDCPPLGQHDYFMWPNDFLIQMITVNVVEP